MIRYYEHISLRELNSFGVDATARRLAEWHTPQDLHKIFTDLAGGDWHLLSGGNNILFTKDYDGTLLHPVSHGTEVVRDDGEQVVVRVRAGEEWDDVVAWCVERGLWGVENLSLIPGYAGAAPVQNIGAYGAEVGDAVVSVEVFYTDSLHIGTLAAAECRFGYRDSVFKRELKGRAIITSVDLRLSRTPSPNVNYGDVAAEVERLGGPTLANIRQAIVGIRRSKLPDPKQTGNAGSFFKNPVVPQAQVDALLALHPDMPHYPSETAGCGKLAAGWLIDRAGWKGARRGRVGVHDRQALVLVNLGGATGAEVLALANAIRDDVRVKFGVDLDMEVNIL